MSTCRTRDIVIVKVICSMTCRGWKRSKRGLDFIVEAVRVFVESPRNSNNDGKSEVEARKVPVEAIQVSLENVRGQIEDVRAKASSNLP